MSDSAKSVVALEQVMDEHGEYLLRLAYLYIKDLGAAEDIVQEVFWKYYRSSYQFEHRSSIKTYLCKMTINRCHDYLRSWKNRKSNFTHAFLELLASNKTPECDLLVADERSSLMNEILSLSIKYREVLLLYYYEELSVIEISTLLDISENTIKTRLFRARNLLKKRLSLREWEAANIE